MKTSQGHQLMTRVSITVENARRYFTKDFLSKRDNQIHSYYQTEIVSHFWAEPGYGRKAPRVLTRLVQKTLTDTKNQGVGSILASLHVQHLCSL